METTATEEQKQMPSTDALMENMRLMNQIIYEMKEIPILPSEVPKQGDTQALLKVEFPKAGGVLTFMEGHEDHPYKGFPYFEMVDKVDLGKKILRAQLSGLYHGLKKRNPLQLACLALVPWLFKDIFRANLHTFAKLVTRFRLKDDKFCVAVRELNRAFAEDGSELAIEIRNALGMLIEFDNAYRYRFQDIIVELDQERLKRAPIRELLRLLEIISKREKTEEIRDTWKLLRMLVRFFLFTDSELRNTLVGALSRLDLSKMALDEDDRHYCLKRQDYSFHFMEEKQVT